MNEDWEVPDIHSWPCTLIVTQKIISSSEGEWSNKVRMFAKPYPSIFAANEGARFEFGMKPSGTPFYGQYLNWSDGNISEARVVFAPPELVRSSWGDIFDSIRDQEEFDKDMQRLARDYDFRKTFGLKR